jgi:hypothetical protein
MKEDGECVEIYMLIHILVLIYLLTPLCLCLCLYDVFAYSDVLCVYISYE